MMIIITACYIATTTRKPIFAPADVCRIPVLYALYSVYAFPYYTFIPRTPLIIKIYDISEGNNSREFMTRIIKTINLKRRKLIHPVQNVKCILLYYVI